MPASANLGVVPYGSLTWLWRTKDIRGPSRSVVFVTTYFALVPPLLGKEQPDSATATAHVAVIQAVIPHGRDPQNARRQIVSGNTKL